MEMRRGFFGPAKDAARRRISAPREHSSGGGVGAVVDADMAADFVHTEGGARRRSHAGG